MSQELEEITRVTHRNELYYIAGFFDGEGSVSLTVKSTNGLRCGYEFCTLIAFTQKTKDILEWVADTLGVERRIYPKGNDGYSLWVFSNADVMKVAGILELYCKLKKPQLALIIRACEIRLNKDFHYKKGELLELLVIAKELRLLNGHNSTELSTDLDEVKRSIEAAYS